MDLKKIVNYYKFPCVVRSVYDTENGKSIYVWNDIYVSTKILLVDFKNENKILCLNECSSDDSTYVSIQTDRYDVVINDNHITNQLVAFTCNLETFEHHLEKKFSFYEHYTILSEKVLNYKEYKKFLNKKELR